MSQKIHPDFAREEHRVIFFPFYTNLTWTKWLSPSQPTGDIHYPDDFEDMNQDHRSAVALGSVIMIQSRVSCQRKYVDGVSVSQRSLEHGLVTRR